MKKNLSIKILFFEGIKIALIFVIGFSSLFAQKLKVTETQKPEPEGFNWGYILILGLGIALGGAIFWWLNRRKNEVQETSTTFKSKNQSKVQTSVKNSNSKNKPLNQEDFDKFELVEVEKNKAKASLPVFTITKIELSKPFIPLPLSNDESLLSAIEQANEEFEEDEEIRALALKVLAAFKKRNSIEAISQIALYDVSVNLRSKAVKILSEFNHESVFETILFACADPSREVRAAAARGLFQISFERTDAWLRLAESTDAGRVRQAARAIIVGDLVDRSIERLVHRDKKYAYEAFAIVLLLLKAGETKEMFNALYKHNETNIRNAILHIIKVTGNTNLLEKL